MVRFLPFILIPILILGGLGYWRYAASKNNLTSPRENKTEESQSQPLEVPKTLPEATLEDRIKALENLVNKLVIEVNKLKAPNSQTSTTDSQVSTLDAFVTELKARVSALEKATPAPQSFSTQSTIYIPLGSGGSWGNQDWYTTNEYQISLDPANYPGYTGMVLEVTFRLVEGASTGYVRLYNTTDSSATSPEVTTTSSTFSLQSSSSFKLASGTKTYKLQVKSSASKELFIQSARIKVTF